MIDKFGTYTVVDQPPGVNVMPSHLVCRIKRDGDGEVNKYKICLIAGGHRQIYGVGFNDTFTHICRLQSHRAIFAIAATNDWDIHMVDFKSAYLNAKPTKVIYMRLPPGREQEGKIARLEKCLYGTKQAGMELYEDSKKTMTTKMGMICCNADKAVFYKHDGSKHLVVGVSTDDSSIAGTTDMIEWFKAEIAKHYEINDLGEISYLLSFHIKRD